MAIRRADPNNPDLSFLPRALREDLLLHCRICRENPLDVVADALALHLDELAGKAPVGDEMIEAVADAGAEPQMELAL